MQIRAASAYLAIMGLTSAAEVHSEDIEEVTVSAQRRDQDVNDVGITVNVMSGEQMKDLGVVTAEDLAKFTPGLQINETTTTGVPQYSLRGVGAQDSTTGASSTVGLYFDGVNIPYTVMSRGALFDVERVEVLRGPQGDLYGRNTTAGQINFISKKPTEEFESGVTASYGSYETLDAEAYVSGALSDRVRARVAAKTVHSWEGWQESLTHDDELGKKDVNAIRGILDFRASDTVNLELNVHYVKDRSENQAPQAVSGFDIGAGRLGRFGYLPLQDYTTHDPANPAGILVSRPPWFAPDDATKADWNNSYTSAITGITYDIRPQRDNRLVGGSVRLEWALGAATLTSLTAYDTFDRVEGFDGDGLFTTDTANINVSQLDVFSQEINLAGETKDILWVGGLYYSNDQVDEAYNFFMPDSSAGYASIPFGRAPFNRSPVLQLNTISTQHTESEAAFGHVEWKLTEKLRATLGARFTRETRAWTGCSYSAEDNSWGNFANFAYGATLAAGDCFNVDDDPNSPTYFFNVVGTPNINDAFHPFSDEIRASKLMWKTGLDYHVDDDILLFGTISHGFKSGGFNGAISSSAGSLAPYRPEELTAFEIGAKMRLLDGAMQFNTNTFYYDYRDKQESNFAVSPVGNLSALTNVDKSRIYGAELEMQWRPITGLNIDLAGVWLNTKVIEWNAVDPTLSHWPTVVTRDASGSSLPQAPVWSGNALVSYRWPLPSGLYLEAASDVSYRGSTSGGPSGPVYATPDYTIANVRLALGSTEKRWRGEIWSRNVTNEFYFTSAFSANGPYVRMAGMPRTFGVTVAYQF
ncbi:MAG: TonB-dependent receptor [Gammaproteobacteria bacterium]